MSGSGRTFLLLAGASSIAASVAHLACIIGGPDWFRAMGAGERMARMVERGAIMPLMLTVIVAAILATWAAYAFAAAGLIGRLPLMRVALVAISAVLLVRGMVGFTPIFLPIPSIAFKLWSAAICLVMGACFAVGTWQAWSNLSIKGSH